MPTSHVAASDDAHVPRCPLRMVPALHHARVPGCPLRMVPVSNDARVPWCPLHAASHHANIDKWLRHGALNFTPTNTHYFTTSRAVEELSKLIGTDKAVGRKAALPASVKRGKTGGNLADSGTCLGKKQCARKREGQSTEWKNHSIFSYLF